MKDLRTFLAAYREQCPQDVLEVNSPLRAKWECTAVARHFETLGKYPIVLFKDVIDTRGESTKFPCVINVLGDRRKLAFAIGSTFTDVAIDWRERAARGLPAQVVSPAEAPCKENVLTGDEIDLLQLPALWHHEMDPGSYVTAGMFTTYSPDGVDNCAFHRGFLAGPREIRVYLTPRTHAYQNMRVYEARGREMRAAYWVGHHPAVLMGAQTRQGYPASHYSTAGAVAGEPLRLVPSESLGPDFLVPADAEFVLEGIIRPGRRDLEGPFGEYTRYYGPQQMSPVMEVTAVTHRNEAIWHSLMVGINNNFGGTQEEGTIYAAVKRVVPQVTRVFVPVSGSGRFHAYIQIRKTHNGQPREAIMAALSASEWIKHVVVVDEDIDIYDDRWVLWAIATRSQWDRDVLIVPHCLGSHLDPTADREAMTTKAGIDATKPAPPARFPVPVGIPRDVLERVRLQDILTAAMIAGVPLSSR